ncbi:MAG: hypothetical protein JWR40_1209 [Massilia sp.]|nr:hypothetical protein [Massilia sp.]MDB5948896.1 hypothetical protein [Massilia sp.]
MKCPAAEPGQVVITGMNNPDMRSCRAVVAGLDAFDEYRHFAPLAPQVRFHLVDGERKLELKLDGSEYQAPIGDKSWPDDTRIELRLAEAK